MFLSRWYWSIIGIYSLINFSFFFPLPPFLTYIFKRVISTAMYILILLSLQNKIVTSKHRIKQSLVDVKATYCHFMNYHNSTTCPSYYCYKFETWTKHMNINPLICFFWRNRIIKRHRKAELSSVEYKHVIITMKIRWT